jgi:hypothetical protein
MDVVELAAFAPSIDRCWNSFRCSIVSARSLYVEGPQYLLAQRVRHFNSSDRRLAYRCIRLAGIYHQVDSERRISPLFLRRMPTGHDPTPSGLDQVLVVDLKGRDCCASTGR